MLQRQGLVCVSVCVSLSVCIKNISATAGSHSGQLQYSIWVCTRLLVYVCVCRGDGEVQAEFRLFTSLHAEFQ